MTPQLLLRPSPAKNLAFGALCAVLTLGGVWLVLRGDWVGWPTMVMFGVGALLFLVQMVPSVSFLRLTDEGFEMCSLGRQHRYRWEDVTGFRPIKIRHASLVGFDFVPGYGGHAKARALAVALSGTEGALPDTYGRSVQALADLMNDWKRGVRTFDS